MSLIESILSERPDGAGTDLEAVSTCVIACFDCVQVCTACADACLSEDMLGDMVECIRKDLNCADICAATGTVVARVGTRYAGYPDSTAALLRACAAACRQCAEECAQHAAEHGHCRICAETCRRCAAMCEELLVVMSRS
ncbi:four-helix bundle copper-binding protein [Arthrobacter gengyunqii]|uniref:Four-helix bundle copper-binding protein n=1 Tax=Arthrobacter gengyunqii TaxID=2886940 RepID=A0A9X1S4T2_9MICC|nr:four-helix bundle copper-binding protein [Arthrobacter gengyunqii]MCC3265920.1 four-helix bundle copper-binding protein [Arthrobacter gengyunqii]MCC3268645.1 four-helix bundle copper-binding protein [Arthrobacter gengyunqii]UOY96032.1 four-helix bundle copper-binding protein [Arthrobacter gengyunqii]